MFPSAVKPVDTDTRMQTVSIEVDKAYFDIDGTTVIQLEAAHYILKNLTTRVLKRILTPAGCKTILVLHRRLTD